jgi:hypothetical protein
MNTSELRACTKCDQAMLTGGTYDRPFWVCPGCHMAFLSHPMMGLDTDNAVLARLLP